MDPVEEAVPAEVEAEFEQALEAQAQQYEATLLAKFKAKEHLAQEANEGACQWITKDGRHICIAPGHGHAPEGGPQSVSLTRYGGVVSGPWATTPLVRGGLPGIKINKGPTPTSQASSEQSQALLTQLAKLPASHVALMKAVGGLTIWLNETIMPATHQGEFGARSGIRISKNARNAASTIVHEFGHAVDEYSTRVAGGPRLSEAYTAAAGTERVTQYGATNALEGFAEAYAMYASPGGRSYMQERAPKSYAFMEKVFTSDLTDPKAVQGFHPNRSQA